MRAAARRLEAAARGLRERGRAAAGGAGERRIHDAVAVVLAVAERASGCGGASGQWRSAAVLLGVGAYRQMKRR